MPKAYIPAKKTNVQCYSTHARFRIFLLQLVVVSHYAAQKLNAFNLMINILIFTY